MKSGGRALHPALVAKDTPRAPRTIFAVVTS
jgi:hypothetical protein